MNRVLSLAFGIRVQALAKKQQGGGKKEMGNESVIAFCRTGYHFDDP